MASFDDLLSPMVRRQLHKKIEALVRQELEAELKKAGIGIRKTAREHNNSKLALIEGSDIYRRIGSFITKKLTGSGTSMNMGFQLNGPQARNAEDAIDYKALMERVMKSVMKKLPKSL